MTETPNNATPGYYPDQSGVQRYWDGNAWTDQTQPMESAAAPPTTSNPKADAKASKAYAKATRPFYKKKRWIGTAALVAIIAIAAGSSGGGSDDVAADLASDTSENAEVDAADEPVEEKPEEPKMTSGQKNALRAAENYLSFAPFSRNGLVRQLSSDAGDGYPKADAEFAADNVKVDYNEQAAKAAKNYLDISPFSRSGMIQQLSSDAGDGYTKKQAEYGADKAGL